jgi:hypothetical protein
MCNAAAATTSALSIAGGITSARANIAQQEAAYQKDLLQNQMAIMQTNIEAQMRGMEAVQNYTQLQIAQQEANESSSVEKGQIARDAAQARSLAKVMAGESGATGNSQERILRTIAGNKALALQSVEMTRSSAVGQIQAEKRATMLSAQVAPALITKPAKPNKFLAILGGGLQGISGAIDATDRYTNVFRKRT